MFFTIHCRLTCRAGLCNGAAGLSLGNRATIKKDCNSKKFRTHGLIFSTAAGSENKTFTKLSPNSDFVRLSKNPRIAHQLSSRVFV
jgi:hypothetical protein